MVRESSRLPANWDEAPLAEIGGFKNGINKGADSFGHGFPFVNLMDVFGITRIRDTTTLGLISSSEVERRNYNLREGDVLFVRSSVKPSGVGLATLIARSLPDTVFSGFLLRFRSNDRLANSFKAYLFSDAGFRNRVIGASTVSANTNINQRTLGSLSVRFPQSRLEQESIAQALSDADLLIETLERLIAKKKAIKHGMMQQQFALPSMAGECATLGSVANFMSGGTPDRSNAEHWSGNIPWISATTLRQVEVSTSEQHVTSRAVRAGSKMAPLGSTLMLVRGSALHSEIRASLVIAPVCFNQDVKALVPLPRMVPKFLTYSIHANTDRLLRLVTSAGNTAGVLDTKVLKAFELWVPRRDVQEHVVSVFDAVTTELALLTAKLEKVRATKQGMMQELLTGRTRLPVVEAAS
ncbi:restriction endonuclease subunit S [Mycolicibacterium gilvum]|uniref:restriction endonuclease subunit S n=1 Tax=Mycolicibacterium gilvum TaxID=1804 RepID=UPI0009D71BEF|nr:restriction endonuclease subunit S [Mycolicibacterium gilvum]